MAYSVASSAAKLHGLPSRNSAKTERSSQSKVASLAMLWAKNYIGSLTTRDEALQLRQTTDLAEVTSREGRIRTTGYLQQNLKLASAQAWSLTEKLLNDEVYRHGIDSKAIDPWQIAADSHNLFQQTLTAYGERVTPHRLSVLVSAEFGRVRQKYTATDPRVLGFVSMQFHYTGQVLLDGLTIAEKRLLEPYFKVMDDQLYMPLRAAYEAAAEYPLSSPVLQAVQHLLPISSRIAQAVCRQVARQYPGYQSYSGPLNSSQVRVSSIRDAEMFQVYLCLCALEEGLQSVQRELFPLCVMLYPRLRVSWRLVQEMLQAIGWEMHSTMAPEDVAIFLPYLTAFTEMFSSEVFQDIG